MRPHTHTHTHNVAENELRYKQIHKTYIKHSLQPLFHPPPSLSLSFLSLTYLSPVMCVRNQGEHASSVGFSLFQLKCILYSEMKSTNCISSNLHFEILLRFDFLYCCRCCYLRCFFLLSVPFTRTYASHFQRRVTLIHSQFRNIVRSVHRVRVLSHSFFHNYCCAVDVIDCHGFSTSA